MSHVPGSDHHHVRGEGGALGALRGGRASLPGGGGGGRGEAARLFGSYCCRLRCMMRLSGQLSLLHMFLQPRRYNSKLQVSPDETTFFLIISGFDRVVYFSAFNADLPLRFLRGVNAD